MSMNHMGRKITEMDKFRLKANWLENLVVFEGQYIGTTPNVSICTLGTLNTLHLPTGTRLSC